MERFTKSKTDKIIAGVCGGIAEYFDIDPIIVRLLFVIVSMAGGAGVPLYIVLAIVMPEADSTLSNQAEVIKENAKAASEKVKNSTKNMQKSSTGAIILIALGILFLMESTGFHLVASFFRAIFKFWPVILIILGVQMLFRKDNNA